MRGGTLQVPVPVGTNRYLWVGGRKQGGDR